MSVGLSIFLDRLKYIAKVKNTANVMADDRLRNEFFEAEVKLNSLLDLETQGLITRSRAQWTEQSERSTKYFFGLEKSNSKKKSICKLSGAEAGGGDGGVYIPPNNWTPSPPIITKCIPPNILNLPNLLNGDHLVLRT